MYPVQVLRRFFYQIGAIVSPMDGDPRNLRISASGPRSAPFESPYQPNDIILLYLGPRDKF